MKNIEPYAADTDLHLNSMMPYEPCVIKDEALSLLSGIGEDSPWYAKAHSLAERLEPLPELENEYVPEDSVFREFIGKS